jgi:hypothetical protein
MSNKPDWKDAPIWANWLAQDSDGQWSWWNLEPAQAKLGSWLQGDPLDAYQYLDLWFTESAEDWRETLDPRP